MHKTTHALLVLVILVIPQASAKRNDDVVIMKNGDRMTGEIKKLEEGELYFKADYMLDAVKLDWARVERLESKDQFNVTLTNGKLLTGNVKKKASEQADIPDFSIVEEDSALFVRRREVVRITPVEDSVWKQLTGSIDYGFSYTGGSPATTQSSLSADVTYRAEKWSISANGSSVFNAQSGANNTGRNTLDAQYARFLTERWYAGVLMQLLNSQQQDLTLRTAEGAGIGRVFKRTERSTFGLLTGLMFSRENYTPGLGSNTRVNNAESVFQLRYSRFRFKKAQFDAEIYSYPSLSTLGRVRMGGQTALKFEIFRNFYWKFGVYENFDSHPPVHAPRNDFGTSTSFGWTY